MSPDIRFGSRLDLLELLRILRYYITGHALTDFLGALKSAPEDVPRISRVAELQAHSR